MTNSIKVVLTLLITAVLLAAGALLIQSNGTDSFMPHSHCFLFNKRLIALHGISDLFIGLSYVAISATLTYLVVRSRRELPYHWMMLCFALFIVACGATHFMELWTLHSSSPRYWLSGWVKVITAVASVTTAVILPPLIPKVRELLHSAKAGASRKEELEKAYAELSELYNKAMLDQPKDMAREPQYPDMSDKGGESLARVAKEVTVHARELEKARDVAESANRAKDQFLAVLSHELRTPLTPALAAASNLENAEHIEPAELKEALATIRRNIELEARLVDDLLDLTRISKGKLQIHFSTIDLHETIRHAEDICLSEANKKGNDLVLELEAADHFVRGDGARLAQVFWNLILNAVKFTTKGTIRIHTSNPAPGTIRIEVTDTGIGIESGMLDRIFEPFQQGEENITRRYGGLGLGLSVAKGMLSAHGGSITAQSAGKGTGSTFIIELATTEPVAQPRKVDVADSDTPPSQLRILLVEDHEDSRRALERLLVRWGHEVKSASSIAEAVEMFANFPADLLLSDIGLPDGNGIELIKKLRQRSEIKAIAMSGYGMESDMEQTSRAGFMEHLIKPVSAERLKESLGRVPREQK